MSFKGIRYITRGNVRGCCMHRHQTLNGAAKCLNRDRLNCLEQGGYSDREIYALDNGNRRRLNETELHELDHITFLA